MANIVKEVVFTNTTHDIRIAPELSATFPCLVTNTGVSANAEGKKILKAGTPIGAGAAVSASNDVLMNRQQVLAQDTANAQGIILHDTDVTNGVANATILVAGYVDYLKLASDTKALVDTAYGFNKAGADIKFIKGRA